MQYIHRTLESVASGEYNSGEFFIKRPAGTAENRKMGNKSEFYWTFFAKQAKLSTSIRQYSVYATFVKKMYIGKQNDSTEILMTTKKSIDSYRLTDLEDPTMKCSLR